MYTQRKIPVLSYNVILQGGRLDWFHGKTSRSSNLVVKYKPDDNDRLERITRDTCILCVLSDDIVVTIHQG